MVKKQPKNEVRKIDRLTRDVILEVGGLALVSARDKLESHWTSRVDRLSWSRVTASLVTALSGCLKDAEIERLEERIKALEEVSKK